MAISSQQEITRLNLDLENFRTVPQKDEAGAIESIIAVSSSKFYGMVESIIELGYTPIGNIVVLKKGSNYIVKEGNRRIAALKLIHGQYQPSDFELPNSLKSKIASLSEAWKKENIEVLCLVFEESESDEVDRIIALMHGKAEKAGIDHWNSVATARHNRDAKGNSEFGLDLLEKYLKQGKNLTSFQRDRWQGDYPLTVLNEAIGIVCKKSDFNNLAELVTKYPKFNHFSRIENLIRDIGLGNINFPKIRNEEESLIAEYGLSSASVVLPLVVVPTPVVSTPLAPSPMVLTPLTPIIGTKKKKSLPIDDPKHVRKLLKEFTPRGNNREKVVTFRDEIKKLKIDKTPFAFCFLLRGIFEISAKAYCMDNSIPITEAGKGGISGRERALLDLLKDTAADLIKKSGGDKTIIKNLHGALTELEKPAGLLSITSLNQLVHSTYFSIQSGDICKLFGNIYPLLKAMND